MRKIILAVASFLAGFYPFLAGANTDPPIPDFSSWKVSSVSRIELRVSDCASIYIGTETEYNNPDDLREFMRVVSRHVPLPILKCKKYNDRLLSEAVTALYAQKEEDELLNNRSKEIDYFLYLHWRTKKDFSNSRDILDGDVSIWFLPADGNQRFVKNEPVAVQFLTENIGNGKPHNVFSGMESRIGDSYHILRVDRSDIIKLLEEGR